MFMGNLLPSRRVREMDFRLPTQIAPDTEASCPTHSAYNLCIDKRRQMQFPAQFTVSCSCQGIFFIVWRLPDAYCDRSWSLSFSSRTESNRFEISIPHRAEPRVRRMGNTW